MVNELLPLPLTPVGDGQTIDGKGWSTLLISRDMEFGILLGESTLVHS